MDTKELSYFASLDEREQDLKSQLDAIKAEKQKLQDRLMEEMAEEGLEKMTVKVGNNGDKRTVYTQRQIWAGHNGDKQALCDALQQAGLEEYVADNFNSHQLSAYVREYDPDKKLDEQEIIAQLPKEIQPYIKVTEKNQLRTRKA